MLAQNPASPSRCDAMSAGLMKALQCRAMRNFLSKGDKFFFSPSLPRQCQEAGNEESLPEHSTTPCEAEGREEGGGKKTTAN